MSQDRASGGGDDRELDEALEESFPASDPPANTVETAVRIAPRSLPDRVMDNREAQRFEITVDGHTAFLAYERHAQSISLIHTEVPPELRGRHLADALAKTALDAAHAEGLQVVVICPFVRQYLRKHAGEKG